MRKHGLPFDNRGQTSPVETLTIREAKSGRMRHVTLTGEAPELSGALWGCQ